MNLQQLIEPSKSKLRYISKPNKYDIAVFERVDPSAKTYSGRYKQGLRNKVTKKTIVDATWNSFWSRDEDLYFVAKKAHQIKYALFSPKGEQLTPAIYSTIRVVPNKKFFIVVLKNLE